MVNYITSGVMKISIFPFDFTSISENSEQVLSVVSINLWKRSLKSTSNFVFLIPNGARQLIKAK